MLRCFDIAILTVAAAAAQPALRIQARPVPPPKVPPMVRQAQQAAVLERWSRMTPEQRAKALERLPPARRARIEEQLNRYQNLSDEERRQLQFRSQMFNQLPPERQDIARRMFRQFSLLPPDRQAAVREEFQSLRGMPEADRRTRIQSPEFNEAYNPREQMFLRQFTRLLSPPPAQ